MVGGAWRSNPTPLLLRPPAGGAGVKYPGLESGAPPLPVGHLVAEEAREGLLRFRAERPTWARAE